MARTPNPAGNIRFLNELIRKQFRKQTTYIQRNMTRTDIEDSILSGTLPSGTKETYSADHAASICKHPQDVYDALIALRAYRLHIGASQVQVQVPTPAHITKHTIPNTTPKVDSPAEEENDDSAAQNPTPTISFRKTESSNKPIPPSTSAYAERGCIISGGRGAGKSLAIRYLAEKHNQNLIVMQCAHGEQIDALQGGRDLSNGNSIFTDGPLPEALRKDCWFAIEEFNVLHPAILSKLNTILDRTGDGFRLPTGEVIPVGPNFRLILLYNDGYEGTRQINDALKRRLVPIFASYPNPDTESKILSAMLDSAQGKTPFQETDWFPLMEYSLTGTLQQITLPSDVQAKIINLAATIRQANIRFDLSTDILARWIRVKHALNLSWPASYQSIIMDMAGTPENAQSQRAVLQELAQNAGMARW